MALVIEVADSTLSRDRGLKARIYARAGIPVYWILNIPERQLEVYTEPISPDGGAPEYLNRHDYRGADNVPVILDGREMAVIPVSDLLP